MSEIDRGTPPYLMRELNDLFHNDLRYDVRRIAGQAKAEIERLELALYERTRSLEELMRQQSSGHETFIAHQDWVNCPICDESDMRETRDKDGNRLIHCVNHACASNGGSNSSGMNRNTT